MNIFNFRSYWYCSYSYVDKKPGVWGFGSCSFSLNLSWMAIQELTINLMEDNPHFKSVHILAWQRINKKQFDEHKENKK